MQSHFNPRVFWEGSYVQLPRRQLRTNVIQRDLYCLGKVPGNTEQKWLILTVKHGWLLRGGDWGGTGNSLGWWKCPIAIEVAVWVYTVVKAHHTLRWVHFIVCRLYLNKLTEDASLRSLEASSSLISLCVVLNI